MWYNEFNLAHFDSISEASTRPLSYRVGYIISEKDINLMSTFDFVTGGVIQSVVPCQHYNGYVQ